MSPCTHFRPLLFYIWYLCSKKQAFLQTRLARRQIVGKIRNIGTSIPVERVVPRIRANRPPSEARKGGQDGISAKQSTRSEATVSTMTSMEEFFCPILEYMFHNRQLTETRPWQPNLRTTTPKSVTARSPSTASTCFSWSLEDPSSGHFVLEEDAPQVIEKMREFLKRNQI